jgi:hypothetical protein
MAGTTSTASNTARFKMTLPCKLIQINNLWLDEQSRSNCVAVHCRDDAPYSRVAAVSSDLFAELESNANNRDRDRQQDRIWGIREAGLRTAPSVVSRAYENELTTQYHTRSAL